MLKAENVRVWFDTERGLLQAVDGVSLEVAPRSTVGVVGESGSGKSVLSRTIMGILSSNARVDPSSRIEVAGRRVALDGSQPPKHFLGVDVSMIFQNPMTSLTPVVRVGRQIVEPLRYHRGLSRADAEREAIALLEKVRIPDARTRLRQFPHEMSGGMRQRVMIALAIACKPKLLIADEPTTALDVTIQHQILNLIDDLRDREGMSVLLVTHDLGVVANRCDRVAVMYAGKIVETGPTESLLRNPRHPYTEALLGAIPRLSEPSQTTLRTIPGRPPVVIDPPTGCRFAPRCSYAQQRCLEQSPRLVPQGASAHACFFPVGTPEGNAALERNRSAGATASGLPLAVAAG